LNRVNNLRNKTAKIIQTEQRPSSTSERNGPYSQAIANTNANKFFLNCPNLCTSVLSHRHWSMHEGDGWEGKPNDPSTRTSLTFGAFQAGKKQRDTLAHALFDFDVETFVNV
jgi:hypothetical protein